MWTTKPAFKFSLDSEPPGWLIGFFFFTLGVFRHERSNFGVTTAAASEVKNNSMVVYHTF